MSIMFRFEEPLLLLYTVVFILCPNNVVEPPNNSLHAGRSFLIVLCTVLLQIPLKCSISSAPVLENMQSLVCHPEVKETFCLCKKAR